MDTILALLTAHWPSVVLVALIVVLTWSAAARSAFLVVLRLLAHPLLLAAVIALVYDGTRTLAAGHGIITTSLAEHWQHLAPGSYEAARTLVGQRLSPALWDGAVLTLLQLPAWLVLGALGLILSFAGRRRRNINVFAN